MPHKKNLLFTQMNDDFSFKVSKLRRKICFSMRTGFKNAATYSKVCMLLERIMIEISSEQKKPWKVLQS